MQPNGSWLCYPCSMWMKITKITACHPCSSNCGLPPRLPVIFPPPFSLSSSPVILQPMHQQIPSPRPSSTINEPTEECHFSTALNFSFVTGYIPRHEQFSKSAVQIQPSPLAMCTGPSSNTKRKQLTMPGSFPHTT